eukprot:TRINITY_DN5799_c0_g2_i1.p1 TRINITY_DN5799_c0_g2~~TRINITY_DN5799_c0_g2_i1.p1  ORF type:complete len:177 (+),score=54.06 TRINITY_DN5799_c0_g2_i1:76-606(+)
MSRCATLMSAVLLMLAGRATSVSQEVMSRAAVEAEAIQLMDTAFRESDIDGDGFLSREEIVAFAKAENPHAVDDPSLIEDTHADFNHFDFDENGKLSKAEFIEMLDDMDDQEHEQEEVDDEEEDDEEEDTEQDSRRVRAGWDESDEDSEKELETEGDSEEGDEERGFDREAESDEA